MQNLLMPYKLLNGPKMERKKKDIEGSLMTKSKCRTQGWNSA